MPLSDGQSLQIVSKGADPLHLGVAWASDFHWHRIVNVEQDRVMPNTGQDVTASLQTVVNQVSTSGGGVVYFPPGTYDIHQLQLPAYVVLEGAGSHATTLDFDGTGSEEMIESAGTGITVGHQGIANLGMGVANPQVYPYQFLWLGDPYGPTWYNTALRQSSDYFIDNTRLTYSLRWAANTSIIHGQGDGGGLVMAAKQNVVIKNNDWTGYEAASNNFYVNQYTDIQNNRFDYTDGIVQDSASYTLLEGNQVIGNPQFDIPANPAAGHSDSALGFDLRSSYYVAHNTIRDIGSKKYQALIIDGWSGGEEPGVPQDTGQVLAGTHNTLTVAPTVPFGNLSSGFGALPVTTTGATYDLPVQWGRLRVMIVSGQGVGQSRQIANITHNTITVTRPWTVAPNATSQFALGVLGIADNIYQNTLTRDVEGVLEYGSFTGETVANNTFNGGSGVDNDALFFGSRTGKDVPEYFDVVRNNVFTNLQLPPSVPNEVHARWTFGTGIMAAESGSTGFGVAALGNEFTGNTWQYTNPSVQPTRSLYIWTQSQIGNAEVIKDTIVQDNQFVNLNRAILLTPGVADTVLSGNQYDQVTTDVDDTGAVNTVTTPSPKAAKDR